MKLTLYTDYALRVLIHLGAHPGRKTTIQELAEDLRVSHNHLMKVVSHLVHNGFVRAVRGKKGGVILDRPPETISIGSVVRLTEAMTLAECFEASDNTCVMASSCKLKRVLHDAAEDFLRRFDSCCLADLLPDGLPLPDVRGISQGGVHLLRRMEWSPATAIS
ncbi:MAG: Rrf2 family transcriptional regulator [Pseudomonadota bacterium]